MPKKKDSPGELIDKRFDNLENKVDDGFKALLKMHFELKDDMKSMEERLDKKLDKLLSIASNLVVTTEGIKQDVVAIGEHVRQHEDRLSALER